MVPFEAFRIAIPFTVPMRTATATVAVREAIIVQVQLDGEVGCGEAAPWPGQTHGTIDDAWEQVTTGPSATTAAGDPVRAGFQAAVLDATARSRGQPAWAWWGGTSRSVGATAAVGLFRSVDALLEHVAGLLAAGYRSIKLKVAPGHDTEPLRAVRQTYPQLAVGIDGNGAYRDLAPAVAVARTGPDYFEQPFAPDIAHLGVALRRQTRVTVLADESIWSAADPVRVVDRGEADGVVVKLGRLGVAEARRILEWAHAQAIPIKVSGLFETSVGRAHSLAIATRPEVAFVDLAPAAAHFTGDVVNDPWRLQDGALSPRSTAGIGVTLDPDLLDRYTVARHRGTWPASVQEVPGTGEDQ